MNRILITLIFFFCLTAVSAQKNEYKYLGLRVGLSHNYNFMGNKDNENLLLRTNVGDMSKITTGKNYVPGAYIDLNYHMDTKSDKYGLVIGLEFQNNGFSFKYVSENQLYKLTDNYRVQSIGLPLYYKFGGRNIYINQQYFYAGVQYNFYLVTQNIQHSNWANSNYVHSLKNNEVQNSGAALIFGFNSFIYNFQVEFWPVNYINPGYMETSGQFSFKPYSHLSKFNYFVKTGVAFPLNRWLTTKSWRAERVRRILNFGGV